MFVWELWFLVVTRTSADLCALSWRSAGVAQPTPCHCSDVPLLTCRALISFPTPLLFFSLRPCPQVAASQHSHQQSQPSARSSSRSRSPRMSMTPRGTGTHATATTAAENASGNGSASGNGGASGANASDAEQRRRVRPRSSVNTTSRHRSPLSPRFAGVAPTSSSGSHGGPITTLSAHSGGGGGGPSAAPVMHSIYNGATPSFAFSGDDSVRGDGGSGHHHVRRVSNGSSAAGGGVSGSAAGDGYHVRSVSQQRNHHPYHSPRVRSSLAGERASGGPVLVLGDGAGVVTGSSASASASPRPVVTDGLLAVGVSHGPPSPRERRVSASPAARVEQVTAAYGLNRPFTATRPPSGAGMKGGQPAVVAAGAVRRGRVLTTRGEGDGDDGAPAVVHGEWCVWMCVCVYVVFAAPTHIRTSQTYTWTRT